MAGRSKTPKLRGGRWGTERCDRPEHQGGLQELAALLAGSPSAMSYLEAAPPNANPTSCRSSIRTRCSTPGMTHRLDFSSYQAVSGSSAIVLKTISLHIEEAA